MIFVKLVFRTCWPCGASVALSTSAASAVPIASSVQTSTASDIQPVAYVCSGWGHCWHQRPMAEAMTSRNFSPIGIGTTAGDGINGNEKEASAPFSFSKLERAAAERSKTYSQYCLPLKLKHFAETSVAGRMT